MKAALAETGRHDSAFTFHAEESLPPLGNDAMPLWLWLRECKRVRVQVCACVPRAVRLLRNEGE